MTPIPSNHCRQRWAERFPGESLSAALAAAVYVPNRELQRWASVAGTKIKFGRNTEHWYSHESGAVFVLVRPSSTNPIRVAATVLRFKRPDKAKVSRVASMPPPRSRH